MKIVIAPQAFKGTLSAFEAAEAISCGVRKVFPEAHICLVPVADGGDGTLDILLKAEPAVCKTALASDGLGRTISVPWGMLTKEKIAVIEIAKICGLTMLSKAERNPLITTSYGVGEIIRSALDAGCRKFIIGLGGSSTNDGGAGMAQALGVRLLDKQGLGLRRGGAALANLHAIDIKAIDPRIRESSFIAACDVLNPLIGPHGASHVYSPQKGASAKMADDLEHALGNFANIVEKEMGKDIRKEPGGGSAGGLGSGLLAFLPSELRSGIEFILEQLDFDSVLKGASLVITGEGSMDYQTLYQKAPYGVAQYALKYSIPVLAVVGNIGKGFADLHQNGIDAIIPSASFAIPSEKADSRAMLAQAAEQALRCIRIGVKTHP